MSTEPDDLDAFLAEKATDPAFALHWEALQARKRADRPAATERARTAAKAAREASMTTGTAYWPPVPEGTR